MVITREWLERELEALKTQHQDALALVHRLEGGILALEQMLAALEGGPGEDPAPKPDKKGQSHEG